MKRIVTLKQTVVAVTAATTLLLTACGGGGGGAVAVDDVDPTKGPAKTGDKPRITPKPTVEPTVEPTQPRGNVILRVWFAKGESLYATVRVHEYTPAVGAAAIRELLEGPESDETKAGIGTAIPAGTRLLDLNIAEGLATVDLSSEYEQGGGSASMFMRLAQVVYTLTQFPTVDAVKFRIDGRDVRVFSPEGIVLDKPAKRADYEDLLPPIVVDAPYAGQRISSPVTVSGTANVFEATVTMRIVDAAGREIARKFTTATCGSGCRGTYETKMSFSVSAEQEGTLEVFEVSAEDGSAIHVVSIPVVLVP